MKIDIAETIEIIIWPLITLKAKYRNMKPLTLNLT